MSTRFVLFSFVRSSRSLCRYYRRDGGSDFFFQAQEINWKGIKPRMRISLPKSVRLLDPESSSAFMDKNKIELEGQFHPAVVEHLSDVSFNDEVDRKLRDQNIAKSTPIQGVALPIAMSGKNIVGIALTGSGKTLSYLLPALKMIQEGRKLGINGFMCLILAPTREIVTQITRVAASVLPRGFSVSSAYGGVNRQSQLMTINRERSNILVATPGRLADYLGKNDINLKSVEMLILDEADHMLDIGFYPQIREIIKFIRPDRQVMMWSATWPKEIRNLSREILGDDYSMITVGGKELTCNPDIVQMFESYDYETDKIDKLFKFLSSEQAKVSRILIFCEKKSTCDFLTRKLCEKKFRAAVLHGSKEQSYRESLIRSFARTENDGITRIVVASNVAARGLDIAGGVDVVVNFDFPNDFEFYVHRIGRTGRAGRKGLSLSFVGRNESGSVGRIINLLNQVGQEIPDVLNKFAFSSPLVPDYRRRDDYRSNRRSRYGGDFFNDFSFDRKNHHYGDDFYSDRPWRRGKF